MKNKYFLVILFCILSNIAFGQEGYVILNQDSRIDSLIMKQKQIYSNDSTIDGFRIQIFMESGNNAIEHAKIVEDEFLEKFPEIPVYLVFGQPYYRLRIGDFRTRLEADKYFVKIKQYYSNAFITAERINLPDNILCDSIDNNLLQELLQNDSIQQDTLINESTITPNP